MEARGREGLHERRTNHGLNDHGRGLAQESDGRDDAHGKKQGSTRVNAYSWENFLWIIVAACTFHFSGFLSTVMYDTRVNRAWFNCGAVLICINVIIAAYLIGFLSWFKKISSDEWEKTVPYAVPIATLSFVTGAFCCMAGLWPVWGILTPIILFVETMGAVVLIAMVP
ncbi:PREDICTED: transmembrane protein 128-like [Priapulus caudatus]|uniref:Transmembrane protein 128-like n=1 Tax=Priapulus caudatus TaxID=37621 RepID=A0ABM1E005_PRICU|nr:PREDICTED: transmembrane protein 128-like [Priapulus caudatus]